MQASLAEAVAASVGYPFTRWEWLSASCASEAFLMVGVTEGRDNFSFDVEAAGGASLTKVLLVAFGTEIVFLFREESSLC